MNKKPQHPLKKFYECSRSERLNRLHADGLLTDEERLLLSTSTQPEILQMSDHWIENTVGCFPMPLGVVPECTINSITRMLPLAVEETSIIAALCRVNRWIRSSGIIEAMTLSDQMIGQLHCPNIQDPTRFTSLIKTHEESLISEVNASVLSSMVARGGGATTLEVRTLKDHMVIHILCGTGDAMGANMINQACAYLKDAIMTLTGETVTLAILSNLADRSLTKATLTLHDVEPSIGLSIVMASECAHKDPYRATTHNKGILNGMEPIAIATGNDWRALSSGLHAYACQEGRYKPLSTWTYQNGTLTGEVIGPIIVGTVGGVTRLHPMAKMAMKWLKVRSKKELSEVIAAAGLMQNLGALRALSQEGILPGHMKLQIQNIMQTIEAGPYKTSLIQILEKRVLDGLPISERIARECLDHAKHSE